MEYRCHWTKSIPIADNVSIFFSDQTNINSVSIHPDSTRQKLQFSFVGFPELSSTSINCIITAHQKSGQVRSECLMCTFRTSCCSVRLSRAQVPAFSGSSVRGRTKREEGVRGIACTGGYKGVQANKSILIYCQQVVVFT